MSVNGGSVFGVDGLGVVVTGGASGLGLWLGEGLAGHGARVTLVDLNGEVVAGEAARLRGEGLDVRSAVADVSDHDMLDGVIDEAAGVYGRLDVVFANAGIDAGTGFVDGPPGGEERVPEGALECYSDARWDRVIRINLGGTFGTARAAARHMRPQGSGKIIVTTSVTATVVEPVVASAYLAAKAGARHFMHSIALELAGDGITVNAIAPGFFATNIGGGREKDPAVQAGIASVVPLRRVGRPRDIQALALFLASPASDYITGQEILIDGGKSLGIAA